MRVLMLSKACIVGIYQRKLEYIAAAGVELMTVVPPSWKDERGEQQLERVYTEGYTLHVTPIRFNGNFHLHYYPAIGSIIHAFKPDVVHIDEEPYNVASWHALYHAQHAAKTLFFSWQNIQRDYPPPFSWGERWVLNTVDAGIAGTDSAAEVWRAKGYTGPLTVIPQFGTDPDLFQPAGNRPDRPFTVGYVGRLVPEKGVDLLLRAVASTDNTTQLRFIGGGPERASLGALAAELGIANRVTFIAQVPSTEMPAQFHTFDVLALPSLTRPNWKEQFGRVLTEAMASGVPVIGSDSGAIPGVVGDAGLIVPEGDPHALCSALSQLRDDTAFRARLGRAGRTRVEAGFTHEQIAAATVDVYAKLLADH
ncbi:MAG: glycosyltransferase family 4 protein [Chloroflexota bacterium]